MKEKLIELFLAYLAEHHPDMLFQLKMSKQLETFVADCMESLETDPDKMALRGMPEYAIQESCMKQLTEPFGPSQYDYLLTLLSTEFGYVLDDWKKRDVMPSAAVALLENCRPVFEHHGFGREQEDSEGLRDALITAIYRSLRPPGSGKDIDKLLDTLL